MEKKRVLFVLASMILILQAGSSWAVGGTGSFNVNINWQYSADLYYNINGAPPNVCGDLHANRNGAGYTTTSNWICTNGSGNASAGPWTWANQNGDEDAYVYISWPGARARTRRTTSGTRRRRPSRSTRSAARLLPPSPETATTDRTARASARISGRMRESSTPRSRSARSSSGTYPRISTGAPVIPTTPARPPAPSTARSPACLRAP